MPSPEPRHPAALRSEREGGFFAGLDLVQIFSVLGLLGIGLVFIYSTGRGYGGGGSQAFFRQLQWIGLGSCLWLLCALTDYRRAAFRLAVFSAYAAVVVLLILTLRFGVRIYGAVRWIEIGSVRLQPSEFAKVVMVLFLAVVFSAPRFDVNRKTGLLLSLLIFTPLFFLIAREPDLGSAAVLLPAYIGMIFCAGLRWRPILIATVAVLLIGGAIALNETLRIRPLLRDYQRDRIRVFFNPDSDRRNRGYNVYQSRLAVGSGGFSGKGIGRGEQNTLGFLPHTVANNDFIFSVIAEETGYAGSLILLGLYALLMYSIWRTAFLACDPLGRFIACGIGCLMIFHIFVNIGMSIGIAPVTGLPLPFVSYGGSFILASMASCGLLQSVHRHRRRES
ncbi:MAG: rod shape-determining protein RodA [Lentisphaeria bacterium]|nr:rod shape-determining protein RodA [Lentisphaeria bacterium]